MAKKTFKTSIKALGQAFKKADVNIKEFHDSLQRFVDALPPIDKKEDKRGG